MLSCYYFRFSEYACTCKSIIVIPQVVVKKSYLYNTSSTAFMLEWRGGVMLLTKLIMQTLPSLLVIFSYTKNRSG